MSDLPERIWIDDSGEYWSTEDIGSGRDVEYVPATALAERDALLAECEKYVAVYAQHEGDVRESAISLLTRIRSLKGEG